MKKSNISTYPHLTQAYTGFTQVLTFALFLSSTWLMAPFASMAASTNALYATANQSYTLYHPALDSLPKVFMIGQNEEDYEELVSECSNPLLTVCQDSMDLAYRRWMTMLSKMEQYAEKSDFDIKGIKIWLNIFWNPDGTIKHLVYFPKPNSRNMDFEELTKYFFKFVEVYNMESLDNACFSHYGSAAFPTFAEIYLKE